MKNKALVLFNSVPYFLPYFKSESVSGSLVLENINLPLRVLRKCTRLLNFSQTMWFSSWKNEIKSYSTIIIFAPLNELETLEYIKLNNAKARIIYWYWNPVFRVGQLNPSVQENVELWSFDPTDCATYNMKFNTTFYFKDITLPLNKTIYDTVFVGNDKGRGELLLELESKLHLLNFKTYFHIVNNDTKVTQNSPQKIPYQQYLELVSKSKAIIDIIPEGQSGLTLRPMESIFLEKKLITTDSSILDQDFYNSSNVFIIGKDDESLLMNFISTPFIPVAKSLLDKYDVQGWLARFKH